MFLDTYRSVVSEYLEKALFGDQKVPEPMQADPVREGLEKTAAAVAIPAHGFDFATQGPVTGSDAEEIGLHECGYCSARYIGNNKTPCPQCKTFGGTVTYYCRCGCHVERHLDPDDYAATGIARLKGCKHCDCLQFTTSESEDWNPVCVTGERTHALKAEGADASEDGTGRGQPIVAFRPIAGATRSIDAGPVSPSLKVGTVEQLQKTVEQLQLDKRLLSEEIIRLKDKVERMRRAGIALRVKVENLVKEARAGEEKARKKNWDGWSLVGNLLVDLDSATSSAQTDMQTWPKHRTSLDGLLRVERVEFDGEGREVVTFIAQCGRAEEAERLVGLLDGWGR